MLGRYGLEGHAHTIKIRDLSGGQKARVVFVELSLMAPHLLFLDEPTNHLDIQSRDVLLKALQKFQGTIILVSHDRHFLRSLVGRVFEIDHGEMRSYEGDYDYYLRQTEEMLQ
jgi:ATP-binding cassette subfamily F protein 3